MRGWAADLTPLRVSPAYRRLYAGETVSNLGTQMTVVAVPVQVYDQTHSSLMVGLLGVAALLPLVTFGLLGGAVADAMDRRRLVLLTSSGLALLSLVLVVQALLDLRWTWLLYAVIAAQAGCYAVDNPARATFAPRLLAARLIPAASSLRQVGFNLGVTAGPLLAGAVIAGPGFAGAYLVDAVSFAAALWAVGALPPIPPEGGGRRAGIASVLEGLRFLRGRTVLLMTFLVDINAMVFGMPRALFPALADHVFGGGARTVGLLYAAPAVGALLGAAAGGWFGRVRRQGLAVLLAVGCWGAAVTGFGLTSTLWLGLLLLAVAGLSDMVSAVFRTTILQLATPDELRGRLQGVFIVVVAGGPRLGDVESGAVAAGFGAPASVVSGGLLCLAGVALLAVLAPHLARYDAAADDRGEYEGARRRAGGVAAG